MTHTPVRHWQWLVPLAALAALACAAAAFASSSRHDASSTLVIDNSFTLKTSDPGRAFDPTGSIVDRALFDTLFTYNKGDLAHPVPLLVSSYKATNGAKTFTFKLKQNVHFANGAPLTAKDVVFSLNRLINLKGNPAFLLTGTRIKAPGKYTVVMSSQTPDGQLPAILANPSTGILNSKLVKAHGGTDGSSASTTDKAEQWLNSSASAGAGSGPYTLQQYSTTSQVTLVPSKNYWGSSKPAWKSVVVRNMIAATQLINVQRGSHEVAIDLASDQAQSLKGKSNLSVSLQPSTWVFWLFANNNPQVSAVTSSKSWQNAIRYGLDYKSILSVAGPGAYQTPGIIPSMFLGALPKSDQVKQNVAKAKSALAGVGSCRRLGDARVPERPDDQRRPVRDARAEGAGQSAGDRHQGAAGGLADRDVADELPQRQDGLRPLAVGPGLPGSRRLPHVRPGRPRGVARRLEQGRVAGDREDGHRRGGRHRQQGA